jgi:hypothetical protein
VLEWYDFAIYGYFATEIGRQFFRQEVPSPCSNLMPYVSFCKISEK